MKAQSHLNRRIPVLAAAVVLVALLSPVSEGGARGNGPKPKLVITRVSGELEALQASVPYVLINGVGEGLIWFEVTVMNKGETKARGTLLTNFAGNTVSRKAFGPIRPGKSETVEVIKIVKFQRPGKYKAFFCIVDGKCSRDLYVMAIPDHWEIQAFTYSGLGSTNTNVSGGDRDFEFFGLVKAGGSVWFQWIYRGGVHEVVNSTDPVTNCTATGTGTIPPRTWPNTLEQTGYLYIDATLQEYTARIVDSGYTYKLTTACPDTGSEESDVHITSLETHPPNDPNGSLYVLTVPSEKELKGSANQSDSETRTWHFTADMP